MKRIKNSVGIWSFGANATRFMPSGYHPEAEKEDMTEKTRRVAGELGDLIDGYEFHYPGEINEDSAPGIITALGGSDLYAIALGLFSDPRYAQGSFINPDKNVREDSLAIAKRGIDLAADYGSKFIIWPGGEGYNYPFQILYREAWQRFIDAVATLTDYANSKGVTIFLEHKNSEPAMRILMRDIGMTIFVINKVKEQGVSVENLKINMDWQHLIMNGEPLAEYAALLSGEKLLGHNHGNSGWGSFDDDNMVGASYFMQTLGLAVELRRAGYGENGERVGFDLFPYTEDQIEAVRRSVYQWEFIDSLALKIDDKALHEAQSQHDAVKSYEIVYKTMGLDDNFIEKIKRERS